jgi:hypothetical protein
MTSILKFHKNQNTKKDQKDEEAEILRTLNELLFLGMWWDSRLLEV